MGNDKAQFMFISLITVIGMSCIPGKTNASSGGTAATAASVAQFIPTPPPPPPPPPAPKPVAPGAPTGGITAPMLQEGRARLKPVTTGPGVKTAQKVYKEIEDQRSLQALGYRAQIAEQERRYRADLDQQRAQRAASTAQLASKLYDIRADKEAFSQQLSDQAKALKKTDESLITRKDQREDIEKTYKDLREKRRSSISSSPPPAPPISRFAPKAVDIPKGPVKSFTQQIEEQHAKHQAGEFKKAEGVIPDDIRKEIAQERLRLKLPARSTVIPPAPPLPSKLTPKEPVKEEPVKELVKEEPVKEELVKEELVKEELVKEEPVKELVKELVKEELVKEEPVKELVKEEPVKELVKEEPVKEELVKEELVKEPADDKPRINVLEGITDSILKVSDAVLKYKEELKQLRQQGSPEEELDMQEVPPRVQKEDQEAVTQDDEEDDDEEDDDEMNFYETEDDSIENDVPRNQLMKVLRGVM